MVTAGANQAFTNVVLALLDEGDAAVLFKPYYFNHLMALQARGCTSCKPRFDKNPFSQNATLPELCSSRRHKRPDVGRD